MYRKAEKILQTWKANPKKKALLITGQRQAGKTYIVREFGKANYKHYVEINFITTPSAKDIFSGDLNADTLIMNLTAFIGKSLEKGKTLIFLDEIQEWANQRFMLILPVQVIADIWEWNYENAQIRGY